MPLDLKWTTHESGMLSSWLSGEIRTVVLLFEGQNSCAFCLVIESSYMSSPIGTRLLKNVPQLPKAERMRWILENRRWLPAQEDGVQDAGDSMVLVTTSAERRPFGALIHLRVEKRPPLVISPLNDTRTSPH